MRLQMMELQIAIILAQSSTSKEISSKLRTFIIQANKRDTISWKKLLRLMLNEGDKVRLRK